MTPEEKDQIVVAAVHFVEAFELYTIESGKPGAWDKDSRKTTLLLGKAVHNVYEQLAASVVGRHDR